MSQLDRNQELEATLESRPASTRPKPKRKAPRSRKPGAIRRNPEMMNRRYGKPTTYRLPADLRQALDTLSNKHQVSTTDLVVYLLNKSIPIVGTGDVELPIRWDADRKRNVIDPPPISDEFLE